MSNKVVLIDNPKTIKERTEEIFLKNHTLPREKIADIVVEQLVDLMVSKSSARTHISWAAKKFADQLNLKYKPRTRNTTDLKREKAYQIFVNNPSLSRKELINVIKTELAITPDSAATHCSMSMKRFKSEFGTTKFHKAVK